MQSPFIGAQTIVFLKRAISLSLLRVYSILYARLWHMSSVEYADDEEIDSVATYMLFGLGL